MPSPVGHALAGAIVYLAGTNKKNRSNPVLAATLFGSILPDFDFLPGFVIGEPAAFHHGISHSLVFAVLYGVILFFLFCHLQLRKIATRAAALGALAYVSHLLLDWINVSEGTRGVPLLWPIVSDRFQIDLGLFGHFHHSGFKDGIWSVIRWENLTALMRELIVLGPPAFLIWFWREWRQIGRFSENPSTLDRFTP